MTIQEIVRALRNKADEIESIDKETFSPLAKDCDLASAVKAMRLAVGEDFFTIDFQLKVNGDRSQVVWKVYHDGQSHQASLLGDAVNAALGNVKDGPDDAVEKTHGVLMGAAVVASASAAEI